MLEYLKPKSYYEDLYDKLTVEECKSLEKRLVKSFNENVERYKGEKDKKEYGLTGLGIFGTAAVGTAVGSSTAFLVFLKAAWKGIASIFKNTILKNTSPPGKCLF